MHSCKSYFNIQGMIKELIDYNLRHGALQVRIAVLSLLCMLTKDNRKGTEEMNNLIMTRIAGALRGHLSNPDLVRRGACNDYISVVKFCLLGQFLPHLNYIQLLKKLFLNS